MSFLVPLGELGPTLDRAPYLRLIYAGTVGGAAVTQTLLAAVSPDSGPFQTILRLAPVSRRLAGAAIALPSVLLGAVFSLVIGFAGFAVLSVVAGGGPGRRTAAVALGIALIVLADFVAATAVALVRASVRAVGLPSTWAPTIAATSVLALVGAGLLPDLAIGPNPPAAWYRAASPVEAAVTLVTGEGLGLKLVAVAAIVGWAGIALGLGLLASVTRPGRTRNSFRIAVGLRAPRNSTVAVMWFDFVQLIRTPQFFLVTSVSLLVTVFVAAGSMVPAFRALSTSLQAIPLTAPFAIGMYGYGTVRRSDWMATAAGITSTRLALLRPLSWFAASAGTALVALVVFLLTGVAAQVDLIADSAAALALWAAACVGGQVAPFSRDQPFATAITSGVTFTLFVVAILPLQFLLSNSFANPSLISCAVGFGALAVCYLALVLRQGSGERLVTA